MTAIRKTVYEIQIFTLTFRKIIQTIFLFFVVPFFSDVLKFVQKLVPSSIIQFVKTTNSRINNDRDMVKA